MFDLPTCCGELRCDIVAHRSREEVALLVGLGLATRLVIVVVRQPPQRAGLRVLHRHHLYLFVSRLGSLINTNRPVEYRRLTLSAWQFQFLLHHLSLRGDREKRRKKRKKTHSLNKIRAIVVLNK